MLKSVDVLAKRGIYFVLFRNKRFLVVFTTFFNRTDSTMYQSYKHMQLSLTPIKVWIDKN